MISQQSAVGCCRLISAVLLTAQHIELHLTLFALPAGQKTVQHVKLYLILHLANHASLSSALSSLPLILSSMLCLLIDIIRRSYNMQTCV